MTTLLLLLACGDDLACGEGTHEADGACVPDEADTGDTGDTGSGDDSGDDSAADTDDSGGDSGDDSGVDTDSGGDSGGDTEPAARWEGEARLPDDGWSIPGDRSWDIAGTALATGDADGDGQSDLLIGGPNATRDASGAGAAWLVLGPIDADRALVDADAMFVGDGAYTYAGAAVAFAGDLDRDGHVDLAVGAPGALYMGGGQGTGTVYLLRGPVTGEVGLGDADATWTGEADGDGAGRALLAGVDLTGDGLPDLVTAANDWNSGAGAVYLLGASALDGGPLDDADVRIYNLDGSQGLFGSQVVALGDLDGDGVEDLGVGWGTYRTDTLGYIGAVAVFLGPLDSSRASADADALITGHDERGQIGDTTDSTAAVGDVDGDGVGDLLLGNPEATVDGNAEAGKAYLVSGADAADGADVFFATATFEGFAYATQLGISVAPAGDLDGDGHAEVLLAEIGQSAYAGRGGAACLWYGSVSGTSGCADADAIWHGDSENGYAGRTLTSGLDLTGDAVADLVIGANGADGDSDSSGVVYVVPGRAP